jgi:hydroxymethylglutaryl-CoA lyase
MTIEITECPRDAMQGIKEFIPTEKKINYLNSLLKVGFQTLDFGSFVSPKAIPQMQDTANVLKGLQLDNTHTRLLAIVANERGAADACQFNEIKFLGYPFSISETFQLRNTNATLSESLRRVEDIQNLCVKNGKTAVIYLSMAFGNPYGDPWNSEIALEWTSKLHNLEIRQIALADTIGVSTPENIRYLFTHLIPVFPEVQFAAHLHSRKENAMEKIESAYDAGCRKFDSALQGFGGCPMAKDELTGNLATENLFQFLSNKKINFEINLEALQNSSAICSDIFNRYH